MAYINDRKRRRDVSKYKAAGERSSLLQSCRARIRHYVFCGGTRLKVGGAVLGMRMVLPHSVAPFSQSEKLVFARYSNSDGQNSTIFFFYTHTILSIYLLTLCIYLNTARQLFHCRNYQRIRTSTSLVFSYTKRSLMRPGSKPFMSTFS